ncbi:prostaglandin reductase 3-like [Dermatophagoides pteronyssinus]|uniref:15-oxoprostaglandin 13-reductase n=1 Tax=Dermatophagoides pteronyssinus TaxID=6956 RepID=A0A6P6YG74_DERPT|nr:prostaglandin reductase 3-like [Dermatophagoides pteronyssinus]
MTTMMINAEKYKKLLVNKYSNEIRDSASIVEEDLRPPNNDEILIKNYYSGVNATEMNIMTGRSSIFPKGHIPFGLGLEGLGTIEAIGKDIDPKQFSIGKSGLVFAMPPKTYAEYIYIKPEEFFPVPEIKPEYIALLDCGLTAAIGLDKAGMIKKEETVLITAAAGGCGHIGVQWAKMKGCKVIGLCSTVDKKSFLESIGCDYIINYKQENLDEVLGDKFPDGIDVIWETYGGSMFEILFKHLAVGGRIVIVGAITGYKTIGFPDISIQNLPIKLLNKSASIIGFRFRHYQSFFQQYLDELIELFRTQKLIIRIDMNDIIGVQSSINAIEHLQAGKNVGKVIVQIKQQ